jgi:1-acyl-sn-glycerol-3-phosphate acyltransferase
VPLPRALRRAAAPIWAAFEAALLVLSAALTLVGIVAAPFTRRRRVLRLAAMATAYLGVELVASAALLATWMVRRLRPDPWWEEANFRILEWALTAVLGAARRCVGFVLTIEEPPGIAVLRDDPPVLVLARHGGVGDSFALVWLLLSRYDRKVRVALKASLQWDPVIDVALNRLGACFLPAPRPPLPSSASELAASAEKLGPRDALLVFPEGGNWTPQRHRRAIRRLVADRKHDAARTAALMSHVLPPKPAGVLACLSARPELPVVIVAHTGLDHLTTAGQVWAAIPFDRPMILRWWPASAGGIIDNDDQVAWLTLEWAIVDEWIDSRKTFPYDPATSARRRLDI